MPATDRILSLRPFFFGKKEKTSVSHDCSVVGNILLGAEECRLGFGGQGPYGGRWSELGILPWGKDGP